MTTSITVDLATYRYTIFPYKWVPRTQNLSGFTRNYYFSVSFLSAHIYLMEAKGTARDTTTWYQHTSRGTAAN